MKNTGSVLLLLAIIIGAIFLLVYLRRKFKTLSLPCVFFVSGAVKSGKTLLSVHLAIKEYKKALRNWKIKKWIVKIFFPNKYHDMYDAYDNWVLNDFEGDLGEFDFNVCEFPPMLFSNIPLAYVKYNKLTIEIIENKVRIPNKSVCLIDEVSLFADSQLFKDKDLNNTLMRFYKLYGHYSHGGKLVVDSQSIADNHFSFKRCMSNYLYINDKKKLPFITILYVREMIYSEDGSALNVVDKDLELDLRKVLIWNTTYRKYDCFCYSIFTDHLPYQVRYDVEIKDKHDSLKCDYIITLNEFVKKMNTDYADYKKELVAGKKKIDEEGVVHEE